MADVIFVVRHAEAESNAKKYFAGWNDSPLTPLGLRQASALKKRIYHEDIGRAYCSDLSRARDTLGAMGLQCPKEYTAALREKNYGDLEGQSWSADEEKFACHHEDPLLCAPGGESYADVQSRVAEYFEKAILPSEEKVVLIVSHHGPIVLLACRILGIPLANWRLLRMGNCGLTIFTRENGVLRLKLWNSLSHFGLESYAPLFSSAKGQNFGCTLPPAENTPSAVQIPKKKSL